MSYLSIRIRYSYDKEDLKERVEALIDYEKEKLGHRETKYSEEKDKKGNTVYVATLIFDVL